jgi:acetyl esterase
MPNDVHPQIQVILDATAQAGIPKVHDISPTEARQLVVNMADARREQYPPPQVASVENTTTGALYNDVPVRIFRPNDNAINPALVYYHGGGHVFGDLDTHDTVARHLCRTVNCIVISVDYRMAPEHVFPIAAQDSYEAARWASETAGQLGIDPTRLALAGDSAGGNLAAVVALMARDNASFPVSAQCLVYPVADYRGGYPSYERYREGYGILEGATMAWFQHHYLGGAEKASDWRASPLLASSHENLPPALVITAECDVLHDEGIAYAQALADSGVEVEHVDYAGMIHGFFGFLGLVDDTTRAHQKVADFLARVWS